MNKKPLLLNDRTFERTKKRLTAAVRKYRVILGLDQWDLRTTFTIDKDTDNSAGGALSYAKTYVLWPYKRAEITFFVGELTECSISELEEVVIHEMTHILVNEMREWNSDNTGSMGHEERVVTDITNAFVWCLESRLGNER